jgi:hypothetical protein
MKSQLLNPANRAASYIDFQPRILFGVADIDRQTLFNKFPLISKSAKIFKVPTMLTAVEIKGFFGIIWPQLLDIFPDQEPVDRKSMNSWEDGKLVDGGVFFASPEASYATGRVLNFDGGYRSKKAPTSDCRLNATNPSSFQEKSHETISEPRQKSSNLA